MKLNNVEVSGLTAVVVDRYHRWTRDAATGMWTRSTWNGKTVTMSGEEIAEIVKAHTESDLSRVWINGETVNIETAKGAWKGDLALLREADADAVPAPILM